MKRFFLNFLWLFFKKKESTPKLHPDKSFRDEDAPNYEIDNED